MGVTIPIFIARHLRLIGTPRVPGAAVCVAKRTSAGRGYDLAAGVGTVNVANFEPELVRASS
jgi:hypothetical protein